jgi:Ca2+/H+ antiporter
MAGLARSERVVIVLVVLATALAGIAHYADWDAVLAFAIATVALAGLAHIVSFSTEQVGQRFGPAATGLMQSTLGNLPELFVVVFALREGEVVVAQTSIIGSLRRSTPARGEGARVPFALSVGLLALAGAGAAFVSDWFVAALRPTIDQLGVSEAFAGLVVVALAGNAVENVVGFVLAHKGKADLAISVVMNSVAQIAAFLYPVLVLISLTFSHQLTFGIAPVYIGALLITALAVWQITGDGEAVAFEGWALVAIYVILAVFTLYD